MCGRFSNTKSLKKIKERYRIDKLPLDWKPRFNISPSQEVPIVLDEGKRSLKWMKWGLVPSWAKDPAIGNKMINARGETVAEKPSFKKAFQHRRCLIPADGFYEWMKTKTGKVPIWITLKDHELFSFAGLWESWKAPSGKTLDTFTIITTQANPEVNKVHDRMPVILNPKDEDHWLDPQETNMLVLSSLLKPYAGELSFSPVSNRVNSPKNDDPECITPIQEKIL